jgi:hypothetical protein
MERDVGCLLRWISAFFCLTAQHGCASRADAAYIEQEKAGKFWQVPVEKIEKNPFPSRSAFWESSPAFFRNLAERREILLT